MFTNPFSELAAHIPSAVMQAYVVIMFLLVIGGTILDTIHKKSAQYFFENSEKAKKAATREVGGGEKAAIAMKVVANEVLTSGEFSNPKRRISHLMTMYGFIAFVVATAVMIFSYSTVDAATPSIWPTLWHLGALSLCIGGYWFWFDIRVDLACEGKPWNQVCQADLFILSLLGTCTFALIWSYTQGSTIGWVAFVLFIISSTILFAGVLWSKFAHMFFKPAAAFQKRVTKADGSRENLPEIPDLTDPAIHAKFPDIPEYMGKNPVNMGLGIKREEPRHY